MRLTAEDDVVVDVPRRNSDGFRTRRAAIMLLLGAVAKAAVSCTAVAAMANRTTCDALIASNKQIHVFTPSERGLPSDEPFQNTQTLFLLVMT